MRRNNVFGVGILIIVLMIFSVVLLKIFVFKDSNGEDITDEKEGRVVTQEHEGYQFKASYGGESVWEYVISGTMGSCNDVDHEAVVRESYPEQVSVILSVFSPEPDTNCIMVLEEIELKGDFQASGEAQIFFTVSNY